MHEANISKASVGMMKNSVFVCIRGAGGGGGWGIISLHENAFVSFVMQKFYFSAVGTLSSLH